MSILDIYNNPPNNGRQIRFKQGTTPEAPSSYTPYERNDQASLRNSQLHFSTPDNYGYSTTGAPKVTLANNKYFAVGEIPSNLDIANGARINVSDQGHTQIYGPENQYATEASIQDLTTLSDLQGGTDRLRSLER
jgi:hypothetical protein